MQQLLPLRPPSHMMQQVLHSGKEVAAAPHWLIVIPTVPSAPSSLRVTAWRRMRGAGAVALHGGVWVLPHQPEQEAVALALRTQLRAAGGDVGLFAADALEGLESEALMDRFRSERDQEYAEFCEGCGEFRAEIHKETTQEKFTFPELEEIEADLGKLDAWLRKIRGRDFFGASRAEEAGEALTECERLFEGYAHRVYAALGVEVDEHRET